jgi:hypothetical protein
MFTRKRFLLLGSLGVILLAGLVYTIHTWVPRTAHAASGCNTVAEGYDPNSFAPTWGNNCLVGVGNESNFVRAVQVLINGSGLLDGTTKLCPNEVITEDGKFGTQTQGAVKCFQSRNILTVDGVVGQHTWNALATVAGFNKAEINNWMEQSVISRGLAIQRVNLNNPHQWDINKAFQSGGTQWCQMDTSTTCVS